MKLNVSHIAKLANLTVSQQEEKKLEKQLTETLTYIDLLGEIDTAKVQPTSHVTGLENVTRKDVSRSSLTQKQALSNTKKHHEGFFEVDAILDNG
ncbi:MAG: Asp-tRNA(Asn)/Glu-tRNA(Gln) amidotransferase subunit GatC [Candidatus Levyibacteriota bacterium]